MKNNEKARALNLAAAEHLLTEQATLVVKLLGKDKDDKITLVLPIPNHVDKVDLEQILNRLFPSNSYTFEFEYIDSKAVNGYFLIHFRKNNS